jgi:hypothetical protein
VIAVDSHGDLFFTSVANNAVEEIAAVNGVIPPSPAIRTLGSGFSLPVGIAVDKFGDLYVGDALNNAVKEILAVSGVTKNLGTYRATQAVGLDASGILYVGDNQDNVGSFGGSVYKVSLAGATFALTSVGSSSRAPISPALWAVSRY